MLAVDFTSFQDNVNRCMDQVIDEHETMIVIRKNNRNVVVISLEDYNNLMENAHIFETKSNYDWLMEFKAQLDGGYTAC